MKWAEREHELCECSWCHSQEEHDADRIGWAVVCEWCAYLLEKERV